MKPTTTYQECHTLENGEKLLVVYSGENQYTNPYFIGKPEDYDGSATEPASPTTEYLEKHFTLAE